MVIFCFLLFVFHSVETHPTKSSKLSQTETKAKFYQGDIVLTENQRRILGIVDENFTHEIDKPHAALTTDLSLKWNLPIPYYFDQAFLGNKAVVRSSFYYWEELTCLKFQETTEEPSNGTGPSLRIVADNGYCYSYIGAVEPGQYVSLGEGCVYLATAAHEIGHALGLWHEQSRPDRDDYVLINAENIDPVDLDQFDKANVSTVRSSITPYDHGSVMHYGAYDFAINEFKPVIITKNPLYMKTIGQRDELSFYDAKAINKMYCDEECNVTLPCNRDGYTDPKNCSKCRCPDGFGGQFCEKVLHIGYKVCSSQELISKNEWQNLNISGHVECNFHLKANNSRRIQLNLRAHRSSFACKEVCTSDGGYVEVRYEDQLTFGPRLCCIPPMGVSIVTKNDEAVIMYHGRETASIFVQYRNFDAMSRADKVHMASAFWEGASWAYNDGIKDGRGALYRHATKPFWYFVAHPCRLFDDEVVTDMAIAGELWAALLVAARGD